MPGESLVSTLQSLLSWDHVAICRARLVNGTHNGTIGLSLIRAGSARILEVELPAHVIGYTAPAVWFRTGVLERERDAGGVPPMPSHKENFQQIFDLAAATLPLHIRYSVSSILSVEFPIMSCCIKQVHLEEPLISMALSRTMGAKLSKPDPSCPFEVIGASYGRTGTCSMQIALERLLSGPVYHGGTQIWTGDDDVMYATVSYRLQTPGYLCRERTLKLVRQGVAGYLAAIDVPINLFPPELLELFPEAKVVLTTRDPERWWKSYANILGQLPWYVQLLKRATPTQRHLPEMYVGFTEHANDLIKRDKHARGRQAVGGMEDMEYGPELLIRHNESVINMVPKDHLLIMHVREGWEPLAKFLGKPVPKNEPFPHVNATEAINGLITTIFRKLLFNWAKVITTFGGIVGGGAYLGWWLWKSR